MKSFDVEKILARSRGDRMRRRAEVDGARKASRALYSDDAGEPTLLPSFVVYLDELGTAARLGGMTNDDLRADLRAYDDLRWFLHDDSTDWDADSQRILYFSDNLVVAAPLDGATDKCDFGLFYHIWAAGAYQLNMALRGRMLRGGITAGDAYADDTFVTGPAHLQAVLLEEEVAVNPRVLLDEDCADLAREEFNHGGYSDKSDSPYGHLLLRDEDARTFVNYLVAVSEDAEWEPDVTTVGLLEHKKRVEEALAATASTCPIHAKYQWLGAYHNFICTEFYARTELRIAGVPDVAFERSPEFASTKGLIRQRQRGLSVPIPRRP